MRKLKVTEMQRLSIEEYHDAEKLPIVVVLDNVRSLYNVGSVFRTADAFRIVGMALCGITATPPHPEIHKTALGAEQSVHWQYYHDTMQALDNLRSQGYTILAVEQCEGSTMLQQFCPAVGAKYAIVLGNEVHGVQQSVVDASDACLEIPQFGTKHSLNVSVTTGIVLWSLVSHLIRD